MNHHRTFLGIVLALAVLTFGTSPIAAQDGEPTVEELIEKNLEAKGGRETLESVETARMTGTMNMGGMEAPFTLEWKAPDKTRMEVTLQGMILVQAFDGETAWMINPFMGQGSAEKMSEEDTEQFRDRAADFHGPLLNPEEKGYEIEYVGEEDVEGTPTYKLKVVKPSGEDYLFLDQEYYLEIKSTSKRTVRGQEVQTEMAIGDYKEVEGVLMSHSLNAVASGGQAGPGGGFNMTVGTVELNPQIADERFVMPEPAPAEEAEPQGDGR